MADLTSNSPIGGSSEPHPKAVDPHGSAPSPPTMVDSESGGSVLPPVGVDRAPDTDYWRGLATVASPTATT